MKLFNVKISKFFLIILVICATLSVLSFSAWGEGKTVFVSSFGNDSAQGTENAPYKTLTKALSSLSSGGTVVLKDKYVFSDSVSNDSVGVYSAPSHTGTITITSMYNDTDYRKSGAAIEFTKSVVFSLGGDTVFDNITFSNTGEEVYVAANFKQLKFGNGFNAQSSKTGTKFLSAIGGYYSPTNMNLPASVDSNITIEGGEFKRVVGFAMRGSVGSYIFTGTANINILGGNIDYLYGASISNHNSGSVKIIMTGGSVTSFYTGGDGTRALNGSAFVFVGGGEIGTLTVNNVTANGVIVLQGGNITDKCAVSYASSALETTARFSKKVLYYNPENIDEKIVSSFSGIAEKNTFSDYKTLDVSKYIKGITLSDIEIKEEIIPEQTVYLSASKGNDSSAGTEAAPFKTLTKALNELRFSGGTIVVMDKYTMGENMVVYDNIPRYNAPKTYKPVVITSVIDGKDYRSSGAAIHFPKKSAYLCGGATTFRDVTVTSDVMDVYIAGCFNPLTFDYGFEAKHAKTSDHFLYAIGGYFAPDVYDLPANLDARLTINSGTFKTAISFTHVKGIGTYTFTGTAYVTINGGRIDNFYGASNYNHYSGSLDLTFNDGVIGALYAGGDATRRLDGNATLRLIGGTVTSSVEINNVVGNTSVILDSTKILTMRLSYASETIENLAYGSRITLDYNSVRYGYDFISRFTFFTEVNTFGTAYVQAGATGKGDTKQTPTSSIESAISLLGGGGGNIVIIGDFSVTNFTEPKHDSKIIFKGDKNANLTINSAWTLSGDSTFDEIEISGNAVFKNNGHILTFAKGVNTNGTFSILGMADNENTNTEIHVFAGNFAEIWAFGQENGGNGNSSVSVLGGKVGVIYGTSSKAGTCESVDIAIGGGEVEKLYTATASSLAKRASVSISGGKIGELDLNNVKDYLIVRYSAGNITKTSLTSAPAQKAFKYNANGANMTIVEQLKNLIGNASEENVFFVKDGGDGNGSSAAMPFGSFKEAFEALSNGGTLVVVGPMAVDYDLTLPTAKNCITITSVYDGVDYAKEHGAVISMNANMIFRSEIRIENISFEALKEDVYLIFGGYKAVLAEGIVCTHSPDITNYISLVGGSADGEGYRSDLTVASGTWQVVMGGNLKSGQNNGVKYKVTINGGSYYGKISATGRGALNGTSELTINDGIIYGGAYGSAASGDAESYNGTLRIVINGGTFYCKVSPGTARYCTINGNYELSLNGGEYSHLTDIEGTEKFKGEAESSITIAESVDLSTEIKGTITFTNPIRRTADPRIILVDGMYYYVYTTGAALSVYKAANISDLNYSAPERVWDSRDVADALEGRIDNIWPSELQYFSAEEFGEKYEGWYLLFSIYEPAKDGSGNSDGENRRSYVLKSQTKDLQGVWVHPETGEPNIPARFVSDTDPDINYDEWTAGQTTMRYNGKVYCLWVEQRDRGTKNFRQTALLSEMKNPYTVTGPILELIDAEYDWEKEGQGYSSAQDLWYPAVIEGLTPMVGPDGQLFVVYAASGYWTPGYCLGQMTFLGGDLFDINNWKKSPQPIFKKNDEVCGTGGPNLATSPDGKENFLLYHAYFGQDTTGYRYCFMEPYYIDETGFHVGQNGMPSPLATEFTVMLNGTPLYKKISGFNNWDGNFLYVPEGYTISNPTSETLEVLVVGGKKLDASYGSVTYSYSTDGVNFTEGLPTENGTYIVKATLSGNYAYEGLGGVFTIIVDNQPAGISSALIITIIAISVVALGGAAALLVVKMKKKKQ